MHQKVMKVEVEERRLVIHVETGEKGPNHDGTSLPHPSKRNTILPNSVGVCQESNRDVLYQSRYSQSHMPDNGRTLG